MNLYFLRHADAAEGKVDEVRPLSARGRKEAKAVGKFIKKAGIAFNAAYSSPLVRAKETGELVLAAAGCAPEMGLHTDSILTNNVSQEAFDAWLADVKYVENVLLVGHAPSLPERARKILKIDRADLLDLPKGGLVCIEAFEQHDPRILFFVTPASLGVK